jgi:hypothetical protein
VGPRACVYGRGISGPPAGALYRLRNPGAIHSDIIFHSTNASGLQQKYCIFGSLNSIVIRLQNGGPRNYLIRCRGKDFSLLREKNLVPTQLLIHWVKLA